MSGKPSTLYEKCLERTAGLLKSSYWNAELPLSRNPFTSIPSVVIDKLIIYVARNSTSVPLQSSDLRLLLTPGRVKRFILQDVRSDFGVVEQVLVSAGDLERILTDLSSSSRCLIEVKIDLDVLEGKNSPMVTRALNRLLAEAQNVKSVESSVEFDFRALCCSSHLEKLAVRFPVRNYIHDFLEVNGELKPHASLKHLEVSDDGQNGVSYIDVAIILKYCTELISVDCDISRSLEHLHGGELSDFSLTHKYKIQKCRLGSYSNARLTRRAIRIASLTCPCLQDLKIFISDDEHIEALSGFRNLRSLAVTSRTCALTDYTRGLQSLLEKPEIGRNLKFLALSGFTNVDFSSISVYCPNLEHGNLEITSDYGYAVLPTGVHYPRNIT